MLRLSLLFLITGIIISGTLVINHQDAFSELFTGMEIYTETFGLPETFLQTDEIFMLFDTTNIANMSKVTITANLPCSVSDDPRFKVAVGTFGNYTNIIDSSAQSLNYTGPLGSCIYSGTVKASDENITIQRVWLTPNNGTNISHTFFGNLVTLTALLDNGNIGSAPTPEPLPTITVTQALENESVGVTNGGNPTGQYFTTGADLLGKTITSIKIQNWASGTVTSGDLRFCVFLESDDSCSVEIDRTDVTTLVTSAGTYYTHTISGGHVLSAGEVLGFDWADGVGSGNLFTRSQNTNVYDGTASSYLEAGAIVSSRDIEFVITYLED